MVRREEAEARTDVVDAWRDAAEAKGLALFARFDADLPAWVSADPLRIRQVLTNLVSNAVRYGPGDRPVVIRTEEAPEQGLVRIAVTDEGPGIPPEHAARLFERFYRADKARSRAEGGTGLGLAIVKHIALVHGGSVSLDSRVGAGSTFTIEVRGWKPPTQNGP